MTWEKVKLGDVLNHRKGFITISDDKEYKLCRVQLHRKGVVLRERKKGADLRTKKQQLCKANDFIVAEMDAKVGGYGFVPGELQDAIVSSHYYLFELDTKKIAQDFLEVICQTTILQDQIKAKGSTNYAAIRPSDVLAWEISLPPLNKQIEVATQVLATKERVAKNTAELCNQLELVRQLRQAFLREAMQGQLVPQNEADEPAELLLERIKAEKEQLVAAKKIKRDKPLPVIAADEVPFDIPSTWTWCRLGEVVLLSEAGNSFKCSERATDSDEWGIVKTSSITSGYFSENANKYFSTAEPKDISKQVKIGDFLFCRASGSKGLAGKCCIVKHITKNLLLSDKTIRFNFSEFVTPALLWMFNNSDFGANYYNSLSTGKSTSMNNVTRNQIYSLSLPLPPLAEQKRIVAKLDTLMAFCDQLESNIREGKEQAEALLQVALKEALEPKPEPAQEGV